MRIFTIGVAEQRVASAPDKIVTLGLGSCIGLVLYDSVAKIGGMVHIMLPTAAAHSAVTNRFCLMVKAGASRARLRAKIAGGAHMFKTTGTIDIMNVGQRNIAMCHKILGENRIVLDGEDTGGSSGRSIEFCCESCTLSIRTVSPKAIRTI
jgi:chemotaxis protein CheD